MMKTAQVVSATTKVQSAYGMASFVTVALLILMASFGVSATETEEKQAEEKKPFVLAFVERAPIVLEGGTVVVINGEFFQN